MRVAPRTLWSMAITPKRVIGGTAPRQRVLSVSR
jgi:hypothetical protein